VKKNVASQVIGCQLVSATDGSAFTGSVTVYVTGDAGTQAAGSVGSGACTHEGNGFHTYAPAQAETNYDHVAFTFIGTGAVPATVQIFTSFPQTGDNYARLGAPAGASISADVAAIKAETATILSDTNDIQTRIPASLVGGRIDASVGAMASDVLTSTALAASAVTEIQSGLSTLDAAGVRTAVGLASANLDTQIGTLATAANLATVAGYLDTEIAAILADTNELQTDWANGGRLDLILDARASQTSVDVIDDFLDTEIAAIKAKTDNLPVDPADASVVAGLIAAVEAKIDIMDINVDDILTQTAEIGIGGAGLTYVASAADLATVAGYIDAEVGAIKAVTDRVDTTLELATGSPGDYRFSADALRNAPTGSGGGSAPTASQIADAVWDEILSGHAISGSTGEALSAAGGAGDPWITALPGSYSAGQAGYIVGNNLNATVSSRATQSSVDIVAAYLDTEIAAIKAKTDNLPASPAATGDIPTATQNADALLNRDMSAVSDTNARSPLNALRFIRNKWSIAGTTLTVTKEDDATSAWTATVTAAPGADPISGNDPT